MPGEAEALEAGALEAGALEAGAFEAVPLGDLELVDEDKPGVTSGAASAR